jgi:hypothetical protein
MIYVSHYGDKFDKLPPIVQNRLGLHCLQRSNTKPVACWTVDDSEDKDSTAIYVVKMDQEGYNYWYVDDRSNAASLPWKDFWNVVAAAFALSNKEAPPLSLTTVKNTFL